MTHLAQWWQWQKARVYLLTLTLHSAPSGSKLRVTLSWFSSNTAQIACCCSTTLSNIAKAELHRVSHYCTTVGSSRRLTSIKETFEYVPLLPNLKSLLSNNEILNEVSTLMVF